MHRVITLSDAYNNNYDISSVPGSVFISKIITTFLICVTFNKDFHSKLIKDILLYSTAVLCFHKLRFTKYYRSTEGITLLNTSSDSQRQSPNITF